MAPKEILTRELLVQEYLMNKLSDHEIADKYNIKSSNSVRQYIIKFDLHRPDKCRAETYITKEELYRKYIVENKGTKQIAKEIGMEDKQAIKRLLKKWDIPIRIKTYSKRQENSAIKRRRHPHIRGHYWAQLTCGARKRCIDFNIDIDYAWKLFEDQSGKCALSGVKLYFPTPFEHDNCQTASIDRIDSNKGYEEGNVQWIHKHINRMKMNMQEKDFITWCKKIAEYND